MSHAATRRKFIQQGAVLAAGLASGAALAIEPLARTGSAKFKFSLAAYSYRNLLSGDSPELTLDDFLVDCARMGLEGTELTSYYFPADPSDDFIRGLKQRAFLLGLDVSGTAVGNDFCHPPGEARDGQIALVKRWIERAEMLGAPVIRIFSGQARDGQTVEQAHEQAVAGIEECCQYAGQHGVFLALENHGGLTTTVEGMLALVRDVQSPWFGVNLDTGNFHGPDPYEDLAKLAPYAMNVQVKVVVQTTGQPSQPADFKRLASLLRDAAYRGYIVLEYEESDDPRLACPRVIDELRSAFA